MDVVDLRPGAAGEEIVQPALQGGGRDGAAGLLKGHGAFAALLDQREGLGPGAGEAVRCRIFLPVGQQAAFLQQGLGQIRHHPVDGLELQGLIVDVDHLDHGLPGGMAQLLRRGQTLLQLVPVGLGGGKGVIAVAHGEEQGIRAQLFLEGRQGSVQGGEVAFLRHGPAPQAAAALHQLKIVQQGQLCPPGVEGLDDRPQGIVHQQHDMAAFQRRAPADGLTGGQAGGDGLLRGPDEALDAGIIILLQVGGAYQAQAAAGFRGALHQHEAARHLLRQRAFGQVLVHLRVDDGHAAFRLRQIALRQHQLQAGGLFPHLRSGLMPVFRLGGILVAGDAGPGRGIDLGGRQQQIGGHDAHTFKIRHGGTVLSVCLPLYCIRHEGRGQVLPVY